VGDGYRGGAAGLDGNRRAATPAMPPAEAVRGGRCKSRTLPRRTVGLDRLSAHPISPRFSTAARLGTAPQPHRL
jgi:hypothetical protein